MVSTHLFFLNSRFEILVTSLCFTSRNIILIMCSCFTRKSFSCQLPGVYRNRKISNSEELLLLMNLRLACTTLYRKINVHNETFRHWEFFKTNPRRKVQMSIDISSIILKSLEYDLVTTSTVGIYNAFQKLNEVHPELRDQAEQLLVANCLLTSACS